MIRSYTNNIIIIIRAKKHWFDKKKRRFLVHTQTHYIFFMSQNSIGPMKKKYLVYRPHATWNWEKTITLSIIIIWNRSKGKCLHTSNSVIMFMLWCDVAKNFFSWSYLGHQQVTSSIRKEYQQTKKRKSDDLQCLSSSCYYSQILISSNVSKIPVHLISTILFSLLFILITLLSMQVMNRSERSIIIIDKSLWKFDNLKM